MTFSRRYWREPTPVVPQRVACLNPQTKAQMTFSSCSTTSRLRHFHQSTSYCIQNHTFHTASQFSRSSISSRTLPWCSSIWCTRPLEAEYVRHREDPGRLSMKWVSKAIIHGITAWGLQNSVQVLAFILLSALAMRSILAVSGGLCTGSGVDRQGCLSTSMNCR